MSDKYPTIGEIKDIINNYLLEEPLKEYAGCNTKKEILDFLIRNTSKNQPALCKELYGALIAKNVIGEKVSQNQICGIVGATATKMKKFIGKQATGFYFKTDIYYSDEEKKELLEYLESYRCPEEL